MTHISERSGFNTVATLLAILLFVYGLVTLQPSGIAARASAIIGAASVGISANVAPNEINTLAQQFRQKEVELATREASVIAQERVARQAGSGVGMGSGELSLAISLVLLVLIMINFYLDRLRGERSVPAGAVDLRA